MISGVVGEEFLNKNFNEHDVISIPIRTSDKIKLALMKFLRFDRQFDAVCTEGVQNADVSGLKNNKLYEVEIKISKSDFKNELKHKKHKHDTYKDPTDHFRASGDLYEIPNKFYFCVPLDMEEWALQEIDKINIKYGLLIWEDNGGCGWIRQRRSPMHIHTKEISQKALSVFLKRLTSEVINLKIKDLSL